MMTLVDQVLFKRLLPLDAAEAYLRALLESQATHLRNLAARTLLVLGKAPAAAGETGHYWAALDASDMELAAPAMLRFAWHAEGRGRDSGPPRNGSRGADRVGSGWSENGPTEAWRRSPLLRDPEYLAAAKPDLGPEEQRHGSMRCSPHTRGTGSSTRLWGPCS